MSKRVFFISHMAMHRSLEEAREWTPKSEWGDIRRYVENCYYRALEDQLSTKDKDKELEEMTKKCKELEDEIENMEYNMMGDDL